MRHHTAAWAACAITALATTTHTTDARQADKDIVQTAADAGQFNTLATALDAAQLVDTLRSDGPFTVFAPTDNAFDKLPQTALRNTIRNNPTGRLADILKYHVVPGRYTAADLADKRFLDTVDGQRIRISLDAGLQINNASVIASDINASNGIIHVLDTVLIPAKNNLVETADEAGSFSTLLAAAEAAGLAETLTTGTYTVFAPTDEAFANLGRDTLDSLLQPENRDQLRNILLLHVVPGRVYANDLLAGAEPTAANGTTLQTTITSGNLAVSQSNVISADIDASNGVIHVIDRVITPQGLPANPLVGARETIALAIERGVPLFNRGDQDACAAVYEVAAQAIVNLANEDIPGAVRDTLLDAIRDARAHSDPADAAWTLREALDESFTALGRSMQNREQRADTH